MGHERFNWTGCILIHPYNKRYKSYPCIYTNRVSDCCVKTCIYTNRVSDCCVNTCIYTT